MKDWAQWLRLRGVLSPFEARQIGRPGKSLIEKVFGLVVRERAALPEVPN
jgi:hypothetical protein